mmetsp:Transcript_2574/g.2196  ORF Transcript_2574/g.2196 Transcript_2574/m.2196 type:complete len:87 (+) Transcript_2574:1055-1315(+)
MVKQEYTEKDMMPFEILPMLSSFNKTIAHQFLLYQYKRSSRQQTHDKKQPKHCRIIDLPFINIDIKNLIKISLLKQRRDLPFDIKQ